MNDEDWFESRARRNLIRFMVACFVIAVLGYTVALVSVVMGAGS